MTDDLHDIRMRLDELARADLLRRPVEAQSACGPRIRVAGREVVCLCSNDYLALADDPALKAAARDAIARWGIGAGASRLVSGTSSPHIQLQQRLAEFKHAPAALVTSSGWAANQVAIGALAGAGDAIFCDKLNHASILDAAASSGARVRTYPHRDVARLESLLEKHRHEHRRCLIVTDTLFSMDGDLAPLRELVALKRRYDARLLVDEAHATGVLGECGRGAAELLGVEADVDATVGTLSKAFGCLGGFVAGPAELIDLIGSTGRAYMFTTALPPALCAAAITALDIIRDQPHRRRGLLELAAYARQRLSAAVPAAMPPGDTTQIMPLIVGPAAAAVALSRRLLEAGLLAPAIRPPTVPRGSSRLRVSLSAGHTRADVDALADALKAFWPATGGPGGE
jgi:8-amino-7-oxononanoate synthase